MPAMPAKVLVVGGLITLIMVSGCVYFPTDCGSNKECFIDATKDCSPASYKPEEGLSKELEALKLITTHDTIITIEGLKGDNCKVSYSHILYQKTEGKLMVEGRIDRLYCYMGSNVLGHKLDGYLLKDIFPNQLNADCDFEGI